jgi:hypothetical protein
MKALAMSTSTSPTVAFRHGLAKKRTNALVAILSGGVPAAILLIYLPFSWWRSFLGLTTGLVWGNWFEYAYHRWLLHRPRSALGKGHIEHHANVGTAEEAEHVALGKSPVQVLILFALNAAVMLPIDLLFRLSMSAGVFIGWAVYLIITEEVHWRIHMQGWLPPGLRSARIYHMRHHDIPNTRYNVFLPLFDWLLGTSRPGVTLRA